jgi:hypothetical protein
MGFQARGIEVKTMDRVSQVRFVRPVIVQLKVRSNEGAQFARYLLGNKVLKLKPLLLQSMVLRHNFLFGVTVESTRVA